MGRDTIASNFSLERISKNPAVFDPDKLAWMNQVYLKEMGAAAFVAAWQPYLLADSLATPEDIVQRTGWFEAVYPLVVERIHTLSEVNEKVAYLFSGEDVELEEASRVKFLETEDAPRVLEAATQALAALGSQDLPWDVSSIEFALRAIPELLQLKPKTVFQTIRVAISGKVVSLPLFESMELIGKDACLKRIESVLI